ncbi:hypothetical protein AcW1_000723 [Taiwanofungus camphoratus]|nr:hypothetical protein AcW1_000723 [Antrodia cinnamomea]
MKDKDKAKAKKDAKEVDAGAELGDSRLQGVNVTEDDLLALVEELGLGGDEANDLVKGLTGESVPQATEKPHQGSEAIPEQTSDENKVAGATSEPNSDESNTTDVAPGMTQCKTEETATNVQTDEDKTP